jgi:tetratricopeptide (TPR) repeat protein
LLRADVDALINRGTALQLKGNLERARADYDEALRIAPDTAAALGGRGKHPSGARRI